VVDRKRKDNTMSKSSDRRLSGATIARNVKIAYYNQYDTWIVPYSYLKRNYYSDTLDTLPDYMVLTREEIAAINMDYNTDKLLESVISCDGMMVPGTPFTN